MFGHFTTFCMKGIKGFTQHLLKTKGREIVITLCSSADLRRADTQNKLNKLEFSNQ